MCKGEMSGTVGGGH